MAASLYRQLCSTGVKNVARASNAVSPHRRSMPNDEMDERLILPSDHLDERQRRMRQLANVFVEMYLSQIQEQPVNLTATTEAA